MDQIRHLVFILMIVLIDQISKWGVMEHLIRPNYNSDIPSQSFPGWLLSVPEKLPYTQLEVLPIFNIVMVWNKGISFGMLNHQSEYGPLFLIALSLIISLLFLIWLMRSHIPMQSLGIALVIGGALGNVIDRARFGAVIDFLDFHAFGYHWPAFNVADSCIVAGVAFLIIYTVFFEKHLHQP